MSDEPAKAIERGAKRLAQAVAKDLKKAETEVLNEIKTRLRTAAVGHTTHDGKVSDDLENVAKQERHDAPTAESAGGPGTTTPAGPRTSQVPDPGRPAGTSGNGKPMSKSEEARRRDPGYGKTPVRTGTDPITEKGAAPYDPNVAAKVPPWGANDVKTRGVLVKDGEEIPLASGKKGPSQNRGGPGTGMNGNVKTHVEAHAGASLKPGEEATLYINRVPCPGDQGCEANLAKYVPKGATLTVYGPDGYVRVVHGEGPA